MQRFRWLSLLVIASVLASLAAACSGGSNPAATSGNQTVQHDAPASPGKDNPQLEATAPKAGDVVVLSAYMQPGSADCFTLEAEIQGSTFKKGDSLEIKYENGKYLVFQHNGKELNPNVEITGTAQTKIVGTCG